MNDSAKSQTQLKKSLNGRLILLVVLLGLLTVLGIFLLLPKRTKAKKIVKDPEGEPEEYDTLEVYDIVKKNYPDCDPMMITAVAMHETGNFSSSVFANNNNLFGMRHPKERETLSKGDVIGYAKFDSLQDSVKDLRLWFEYNKLDHSYLKLSDLITTMKSKGYFEASYTKYLSAVQKHYNKLRELIVGH